MDNLNNLYVPVRERIFTQLASKAISQRDFAKAINVSPQTITAWKMGENFSFMKKLTPIAEALGTSEVWLLTGKNTALAPGAVGEMEAIADSEGIHLVDLIGAGRGLDQYIVGLENIIRKDGGKLAPEDRGRIEGMMMLGHRHLIDKLPPEDKREYLGMLCNMTTLRNIERYCQAKGVSVDTACVESGAGEGFLSSDNLSVSKLQMLASYLGVTVSELLGEEKPTPVSGDGLDAEQLEFIRLYDAAAPALRAAALAVLRSGEEQGKAPDGVSTGK